MAAFRAAARASAMLGLRLAQCSSTLRPEKPARAGATSESLGPVKEPARFRGMARMSRRDSFLACSAAGRTPGSGLAGAPRSPSADSVSEASPSRARRSREARVGRGVDRLLERVRACCTFWALPEPRLCSSRAAGDGGRAVGFWRGPGRPVPLAPEVSWSEVMASTPDAQARPEPRSSSGKSEGPRGLWPHCTDGHFTGSTRSISVMPGGRHCFSERDSRAVPGVTPAASRTAGGDSGFSFGSPVGWGLGGLGPFLPLSRLRVLAVSTSESPDRESSRGPGALPASPLTSSGGLENSRASRAARAVSVSFKIRWVSWECGSMREARAVVRSCRRGWLEMYGSWLGAGGQLATSLVKLSCQTKAEASLAGAWVGPSGPGGRPVRSWRTSLPLVLT